MGVFRGSDARIMDDRALNVARLPSVPPGPADLRRAERIRRADRQGGGADHESEPDGSDPPAAREPERSEPPPPAHDLGWEALAATFPQENPGSLPTPRPSAARVAGVYSAHQTSTAPDAPAPGDEEERAA